MTALVALGVSAGATSAGSGSEGVVFVATNHNNTTDRAQPANQIVMYRRGGNGSLTLAGRFATGGQGSGPGMRFAGDGLGSGNSVRLSQDARFLFVTNAGSNSVTVFRVMRDGLERTDVVSTGSGKSRRFPNSVTQHGNLVYVLNSADAGSITGFRLSSRGTLTPIAGSTRMLAAKQLRYAPDALYNPTQVEFTPDGSKLVATIKDRPRKGRVPMTTPTGPGRVLVWDVEWSGQPSAEFTQTDFENRGPFGFSFDRKGSPARPVPGRPERDRQGQAQPDLGRRLVPHQRRPHSDHHHVRCQ
ncbi:MAG: beta-propeller fold lactonase family protein [Acidobacteria bacterium]|nr:beta-propeller fold lactonase family protein [Acidobacteriota bacterium]